MMGGGMMGRSMMGLGFGGILIWIVIIAAIGIAVYFIVKSRRSNGTSSGETPLDTVKKRYARGEISREEYDQIRRDLS
jgi:putative membrane protein